MGLGGDRGEVPAPIPIGILHLICHGREVDSKPRSPWGNDAIQTAPFDRYRLS